jgi:hypothetical protein
MTERLERHDASTLSAFVVIYGSTRLFRALRRAMNQLWGIDLEQVERARGVTHKYGVRYGGAFALALFVALLVALLVIEKTVVTFVPERLAWPIDLVTSGGLAFVLFAALFRVLPETNVTMREASVSALVTTVLFGLGSSLVTLYVRHKHIDDLYAGASAIVIAVVWVYYSAQVFFFGACIGAALRTLASAPRASDAPLMSIDVHVTGGGTITNGELRADTSAVASCSLCAKEVDAAATLGNGAAACAPCLRDRLDALSVARFRLRESRSGSLPWGKVTG